MGLFGKGKVKIGEELWADLAAYLAENLKTEDEAFEGIKDAEFESPKLYAGRNISLDKEAQCDIETAMLPDSMEFMPMMLAEADDEFSKSDDKYCDADEVNISYEPRPHIKEHSVDANIFGKNSKCDSVPMAQLKMAAPAPMAAPKRSLDDVIDNLEKSFMELVYDFADAKGMTDLEVRKKAEIDKRTFSKLKCGTTKVPSKNTALALAIALELNLDETRDLLARAGLAISPCSKSDMIVQYFIEHEAYDIGIINDALDMHGEAPLGSLKE